MTVSNIRQNILVDIQGRQLNAEPGKPYERIITIQNRENQEVNLFLWLTAKGKEEVILRWYDFELINPSQSDNNSKQDIQRRLAPGQSIKVSLTFDIPLTAEPGIYNYEVCVQGSSLGEPICRHEQLVIPYSKQYWDYRKEPEFLITPPSTSENPQILQAGEKLTFEVAVKNRSNIVDRFFIAFPELNQQNLHIDIDYSGSNPIDGLRLNPETEGTIKLCLQPDQHTVPGQYFSTVRLKSQKTNRSVLGMIYFNIPIDDRITLTDLSPASRNIPCTNSLFTLKVRNPGNIQRQIQILAQDEAELFVYNIKPNNFLLQPGDEQEVSLTPKNKLLKELAHLFQSQEQIVPFHVGINHVQENKSAILIWKPNPSWFRWLIIIYALLLIVYVLSEFLIKPGVWNFIVKPSLQPKITALTTTDKSYQAETGKGITLNWEIRNIPQDLNLNLTEYHNDVNSKTSSYNFNLKSCKTNLLQTNNKSSNEPYSYYCGYIIKNNIAFYDLVRHIFKAAYFATKKSDVPHVHNIFPIGFIEFTNQNSQNIIDKENFCQIEPVISDKSFSRSLWKFIYGNDKDKQEMQDYIRYEGKALKCRKMLAVPLLSELEQQKEVKNQPQGRNQEERRNNQPQDGKYEFKLDISQTYKPNTVSDSKTIKDIAVAPPQPEPPLLQPQIQEFAPTVPVYRQLDVVETNKTKPETKPTPIPIELNWVIANPKNIEKLELKATYLGSDNRIYSKNNFSHTFLKFSKRLNDFIWVLPKDLKSCTFLNKSLDSPLACKYTITNITEPRQYKFTLTATPIKGEKTKHLLPVSKTIETVQIRPILPLIEIFKVNDQDVIKNPNQVLTLEPGESVIDVALSWQIKNRQQMTVELLPAPGVLPHTANEIQYKLSPNPGKTPITLKVTNQIGESVTQTVILETVLNMEPQIKPGTIPQVSPPSPPPDGAAPSSNSPLNPQDLPPYELPPRTN